MPFTNDNPVSEDDAKLNERLEQSSQIEPEAFDTIAKMYKPENIDDDRWNLLWRRTLLHESGGNTNTKESTYGKLPAGKRAYGVGQILPATAVKMGFSEDEIRNDPLANFAASVKYLGHNYKNIRKHSRVRDDEHAMVLTNASYFTGDTRVIKNLDDGGDGVPDVDDGAINARDYALRFADNIRPDLDKLRERESQRAIQIDDTFDAAKQEAGIQQSNEPVTQTTGVLSRIPTPQQGNEQTTEQMFADANKRIREQLGISVPETHPHKMSGQTQVMIPFTPGQQVTADVISDAITDSLTGQQGYGQRFRQAIGENPGDFKDDITNEWLQREMQAGRITYVPSNPKQPNAGGYLRANIPVQNYVKNRIDAFAAGGAKGVEENTAAMRKEVAETARLVAEEEYGKQISRLNKLASETKDTEQRQRYELQAAALQSQLDKEYPTTFVEETWRGIKRGLANTFTEYQQLGLNLRNLAEASTNQFSKAEQAKLRQRDERYQAAINELRGATPEARMLIGDVVETLEQAFLFDAPVYAAGGTVLGPAGLVYTTAARSAHKPPEELAADIAAALIEIPVSKGAPALLGKLGRKLLGSDNPLIKLGIEGAESTLVLSPGRAAAGKALQGIEHAAEDKALGRLFFGGLGETGGDAIVDFIRGKEFDAKQAFLNFVAGGAFEIGAKKGESEGGTRVNQEPRQFVEPMSPMAVTIGEDGKPRYQMIIGNKDAQSLVEIPANHPYVIKYAGEVENGNLKFMNVTPEQFDKALQDFAGEGKVKLPTLTAQQAAEYLSNKPYSKESEVKTNDSEVEGRVSGEVRVGQEPEQTRNVEGKGEEAAATGGVLQTRERSETKPVEEVAEDKQINVEGDEILRSASEKLGTTSAREIGNLIEQSNKRFRVSNTPEEQQVADDAYSKVSTLSTEENQALAGVLPARFFAPVREPGADESKGKYSRSVNDIAGDESDAQLDANLREVATFFAEKQKTDKTPAAKSKRVPEFEREQTSIVEGSKKVKVNGIEITLPKDIATRWDAINDETTRRIDKLTGSYDDKLKARRQLLRDKKNKRLLLLNEYRAREEEQFERGYLKGSQRPVVIVKREEGSDFITIRAAGEQETKQVRVDDVETRKERAIKPVKDAKLPLIVRTKQSIGSFDEKNPVSFGYDGTVYINNNITNALEDVMDVNLSEGFTVRPSSVDEVVKKLNDAGLNNAAKQIEKQAKANPNGSVAIVNVASPEAGLTFRHERIHTKSVEKELSESTIEKLSKPGGSLDKLAQETDVESIQNLDAYDLVQEVLAYGLTGDYEGMGVTPDTLYDAVLDVVEAYINEFPSESIQEIAEFATINFNNVQAEANRRIKNAEKQNTGSEAIKGEGKLRTGSETTQGGQKERGKEVSRSPGLRREAAETSGRLDVDQRLASIADEYTREHGLGTYDVGTYFNFKPEVYKEIADLMESNPHDPDNPNVKRAYDALARETIEQYKYLESKGVKFEPWTKEGQPYRSSIEMRKDVRENNHLYFFTGGDMAADHPMKADSGIEIDGTPLVINDVFRAVHDYFGHAVSGAQFGTRGELNATDSHARMYSQEALPALVGETVFQNAWVNYGPHIRRKDGTIPVKGDQDFIPPQDRPFAEQKAMDITPEQLDLWRSAYTTPPKFNADFTTAEQAGAGREDLTRKREDNAIAFGQGSPPTKRQSGLFRRSKIDPAVEQASKKKAADLTPADVETIVRLGRFAMLSGNTSSDSASKRGVLKTQAMKRELEKVGYTVLEADGKYTPDGEPTTVEPSLFIVLRNDSDIANLLRIGARYKQAQVLVGNQGEYRAPFTKTVPFGKRFTETFSETGNVLFGDEAEKQAGQSVIKTSDGEVTFSVPDAFGNVRKQAAEETKLIKQYERAFKASFANRAQSTSSEVLDWLRDRELQGQREKLSVRAAAEFLENITKEIYGGPVNARKLTGDEYDAQRVRRAVRDGIAFIKNFTRGKSEQASGQSWYAESIDNMHRKTGEAFPEVMNVPQLRALFDLVLAASSQGNTVELNYNYATQIWRRVVEEFDLGTGNVDGKVLPTKQKPGARAENYGRFGPQLEKFNNLSKGYVPLDSLTAKKLKEKGIKADIIETKEFKGVNGAPQKFIKSPELQAMIDQYGRIGGVFEYLLQPGSTTEDPFKATEILGPKIGAFFLNISGFNQLVTVDMWAARWWYRINGGLINEAQDEIQDTPRNTGDGDLIRGTMQAISEEWNRKHQNKLSPADVQAILWYGEKDVWTRAGAEDSGQVDFFDAANRYVPELVRDMDSSTLVEREKAVANFIAASPEPGPLSTKMGTEKAKEEREKYFVRQMSVPGRLGLAKTSRRQQMNRNLLNFDANEWNRMAEYAKGSMLEPGESTELNRLLQNGYAATDKASKDAAIAELQNFIDSLAYQDVIPFLLSVRKAGLLSGLKTFGRNQISNFAHGALDEVSRGVSAPVDMVLALTNPNRQRTIQGISPKAIAYAMQKGFTQGLRDAKNTLIHGNTGATFETFNVGYDPKSGYKWLDNTVGQFAKYVFRLQGAGDAVGRTYAYHRALYELGWLSEKNGGRPLHDVLNDPTIEESDMAWRAAEVMVFQNDNAFNTAYQRMKSKLGQKGVGGKALQAFLDYEAPFVKTGSNIFARTLDYTILGAIPAALKVNETLKELGIASTEKGWTGAKENLWNAIDTPETRRTIVQAFSKGLVGLGIAYMGYRLAAAGLLYGADDDDEKERNKRQAQGAGPGHLRIGDRWYDIRAFSPFSAIMLSGASLQRALTKEVKDEGKRAGLAMGVLTSMVVDGLPLARQTSDILSTKAATNLPERMLALDSWVPSIVNEIGQTMDESQRETKGETFTESQFNKVKAKIPGLRESLPVKTDALGKPLPQPSGQDPFASKKANDDPTLKEIGKVGWSLTGIDRKKDKKGKEEPLAEFKERKQKTQDLIKRALDAVIQDPDYPSNADKTERKEILDEVAQHARSEVKKGDTPNDEALRDAVSFILERYSAKKAVESDNELDEKKKKKLKSRIGRKYGKKINREDEPEDNE